MSEDRNSLGEFDEAAPDDELDRSAPSTGLRAIDQPVKLADVSSIEDFLIYAYARGGSTFSIRPSIAKSLAEDGTDSAELRDLLQRLSDTDPLVGVPPRILSAIDRAKLNSRTRKALIELAVLPVGYVLYSDPETWQARLFDPVRSTTELIDSVSAAVEKLTETHRATEKLKPAKLRSLKTNVLTTVIMFLALEEDWPPETLAEHLDIHVWQPEYEARQKTRKKLSDRALLIDGSSGETLGLLTQSWRQALAKGAEEVSRALEEAEDTRREMTEAIAVAERAEAKQRELEELLEGREAEIAQLKEDLQFERGQRRVERSHAVDDYENLRTRLIRSLTKHVDLLESGLHALRHGSNQVTDEYLDRVLDDLRAQVGALQESRAIPRGDQ